MCLKVFLRMNLLLCETSLNKKDFINQKSDKGNPVLNVDRDDYIKKMENILNGQRKKLNKVNLKDDTLINFAVNPTKTC